MTDETLHKSITTLNSYDNKIVKLKNDLKKLQDKRESLYLRTISNTIKDKDWDLISFFNYLNADKGKDKEHTKVD